MTSGLLVAILTFGAISLFILSRRMFKINLNLFKYLENSGFAELAKTAEVSMSVAGACSWQQFKMLSDTKNLILIEDYDLNLSPQRKLSADTYLIAQESELKKLPLENFRKIVSAESISVLKNGNLRITGQLSSQAVIRQLDWIPSGEIEISIRRPKNGFDWNQVVSIVQ